jgi:hypothetical protein
MDTRIADLKSEIENPSTIAALTIASSQSSMGWNQGFQSSIIDRPISDGSSISDFKSAMQESAPYLAT